MLKNDIFKKFLQNPELKEKTGLTDKQIEKIDLFSYTEDKVLEVIKTAILHSENGDDVDLTARKVNQLFKKDSHAH